MSPVKNSKKKNKIPIAKKLRKLIRSSIFKAALITTAACYVILCFFIATSEFNSKDPEPPIQSISIDLTKQFAAFTVHVETGLFIRNFSYFNMLENKFIADLLVWFRFDPTEITLDTIENFSFDNGKIIQRSPPDIKAEENKTFVKYNVKLEFKSDLDYCHFPIEDHKVSLVLTNHFVTPYEVMFEVLTSDFVVDEDIFVYNWKLVDLRTNFGIDENVLNQVDKTKKIAYPKATFTMDFMKAGLRKAFIIFAPIFIIFFFGLFSFFITLGNTVGKTTLSVAALTALLGYRFVIERMMPKVGYFTTTDYIYIILLIFSFVVFIFNLLLARSYNLIKRIKGNTLELKEEYRLTKDIAFIIITSLASIILGLAILF